MKNENRILPVHLTDLEVENYGRELANCLVEKGKLEQERKVINARIKPFVERSGELSKMIDTGIENRNVECKWEYNWGRGERTLYRTDTGEPVETDIIPEHERQQHFNV